MPAVPVTLLHVETLGVVVPLAVSGTELSQAVAEAWRDALVPPDAATRTSHVAPRLTVALGERGAADVTGRTVPETLQALSLPVRGSATGQRSGDLVLLDALALVDPQTQGVAVLVGDPNGSGLSPTAFSEHLQHLAGHTTGVTDDGLVLPALDPIQVRASGSATSPSLAAPSSLGLVTASAPHPIAALLVLAHEPTHAGEAVVEPIDTIDVLGVLASGATGLHYLDAPLQRLADVVRRAGGARRVRFGEADTLAPAVRAALAGAAT